MEVFELISLLNSVNPGIKFTLKDEYTIEFEPTGEIKNINCPAGFKFVGGVGGKRISNKHLGGTYIEMDIKPSEKFKANYKKRPNQSQQKSTTSPPIRQQEQKSSIPSMDVKTSEKLVKSSANDNKTTINPRQDYINVLIQKSIIKIIKEMRKDNANKVMSMAGDKPNETQIGDISKDTLQSISSTFKLMWSNDQRKVLYKGSNVPVSDVVREIFFSQDMAAIDNFLQMQNIPDSARRVFEDLNVTMPMIEPYNDLFASMSNSYNELNMQWEVDELEKLRERGDLEAYYKRLSGDEYETNSERINEFLFKKGNMNESQKRNVLWGLRFAQTTKEKMKNSQSAL